MKSTKQQSSSFRRALWAEKAREAYIAAKRGGGDHLVFWDWEDTDTDIVGLSQPPNFNDYVPPPSSNGWEGLGV